MSYGTNKPWGLKPVRYMNGAAWNGQQTPYRIASGYNANLFTWDPAAAGANGFVTIATAGDNNAILGSFTGFQWVDANTGKTVFSSTWAANTVTFGAQDAIAFIADDPMIVFDVQGNAPNFPAANSGILNANLLRNASLVAGNGSPYNGESGWMLDQATIGQAANKQVKIIRFVPALLGGVQGNPPVNVNNDPGVAYNNVEVIINNGYYKAGVASV